MLILSYLFYCLSSFGCFHVQPNKWQTFKVGWTKATVNTPTAKPAPPVCWPRTNDEAAPTYGSCRTVLATTNEWYGSICVCCCVGTVLLLLMLRCDGFFGVLVVLVLLCFFSCNNCTHAVLLLLGTGKDGRMRTCKFTSDTIRTTIDRGHSGATRFRTTNVTYYTGDGHGEGTKSRSNVSGLVNVLGVVYVPTVVLFFLMGIFVLIEQFVSFFFFFHFCWGQPM